MQFRQVKSIIPVPTTPIYHLNVSKNRNFFGNGLCLHNCDYYNNNGNEGEIFVKLHNQGEKKLVIPVGEAMAQMMFQQYLITDNDGDTVGGNRTGGFGSTSE